MTQTARESASRGAFSRKIAAGRGLPSASASAGNDRRRNGQTSSNSSTKGSVTIIGFGIRAKENTRRTGTAQAHDRRDNGQTSSNSSTKGSVTIIGLAIRPKQNARRTGTYRPHPGRSVYRT